MLHLDDIYLKFDHNSLLGTGVMSWRILHNSGTQQAIVITLEISSKYLIQYILGENLGNPTLLIN